MVLLSLKSSWRGSEGDDVGVVGRMLGGGGASTLEFDRATQPFLKIHMQHGAYRYEKKCLLPT